MRETICFVSWRVDVMGSDVLFHEKLQHSQRCISHGSLFYLSGLFGGFDYV